MTERGSEEGGYSAVRLSRRRVLQLSSGTAVGGALSSEAVSAASVQSESDDDEIALEDDEFADVVGVASERIYGSTQVVEGAEESYWVNRADHLDFVWSAENGTVIGDGPSVTVRFETSGQAEVSVLVAEEGVPEAVGSLEVSVIEVSIGGPDEVAVGQRYEFEVRETIPDVTFQEWSITPNTAGSIDEYGERAEIEFEAEASPARIEVEYETDSGHTDTAEHEVDVKQIDLQIENARLVQTVENTRVEDTDGTVLWAGEPDPDFVAGRNASIGFDLDGKHVDLLKNDVTIVVEREIVDAGSSRFISRLGDTSVVYDDEFELQVTDDRNDVEEFVDAEHGIEELHKLANSHGVDVPVFSLDAGYDTRRELASVEIRIESDVVESEPVMIEKGRDFRVSNPRTLRIGFIGLKDPDGGENYGEDTDGHPYNYAKSVEEAIELLEKVYPVDNVVAYRHDELMEGAVPPLVDPPKRLDETLFRDAIQARDTLEEQTTISESETVDANGEITEFDATVLVVPHGYFEFHTGSDTTTGMVLEDPTWRDVQPQAACLVQDTEVESTTTPHEVCHLVTQELYEGPGDHPMAQRDSWDGDEWELDFEHARGVDDEDDGQDDPVGVRSVKFDLADGEYHVEPAMPSFMSYDSSDKWIDSRMYQYLIENGFEPSPPETGSWDWIGIDPPDLGSLDTDDAERIEVISGTATIEDDGTATVDYAHRREGNPMPPDGDGNVTLTLQSADGENMGTATTVDEWVGTAEEKIPISGTVPFVVPYPEELDALVFEREGTTSTIDPRGRLLASAKDCLAEESFVKNPEDRLPSLQDKLESVDGQLQNSAYRGAYNKLTNDVRPRVEEWLHDNASIPANYYTRSELLALLDDVIARLKALYDVHEDDKGQGPPDDHPGRERPEDHPGRGPPDEEEIEGGRGPPNEDEEFGRRPSDDEDHPEEGPNDDDGETDDDSPGDGPPNDEGDDNSPGGGPPANDDRGTRSNR